MNWLVSCALRCKKEGLPTGLKRKWPLISLWNPLSLQIIFSPAKLRARGRSLFPRKRVRWPIIFLCCFEPSNKLLYEKEIWTNSQCRTRIVENVNLAINRDYNHGAIIRIYGACINKVQLLLNEHMGTSHFLFKVKVPMILTFSRQRFTEISVQVLYYCDIVSLKL